MILTDYYLMEEIKPRKSHRFDCTESTGGYPHFEQIASTARDGSFYFYYNGVPDTFIAAAQRRADRAITCTKNISSVYVPNLDEPLKAYGDVRGTDDALLFHFRPDYKQVELYIARGYKRDARSLYHLFADGGLDDEISVLRQQARPTAVGAARAQK